MTWADLLAGVFYPFCAALVVYIVASKIFRDPYPFLRKGPTGAILGGSFSGVHLQSRVYAIPNVLCAHPQ